MYRYPDGKTLFRSKESEHGDASARVTIHNELDKLPSKTCCASCSKGLSRNNFSLYLPDKPLSRIPQDSGKARRDEHTDGLGISKNELIDDTEIYEDPPNFKEKDRGKSYYPKTNSIYSFYEPRTFISLAFENSLDASFSPEPMGYFLDQKVSRDVNMHIPALYGRSVGSFGSGSPGGGCSAWLSGGPYVISAGHGACGDPFDKRITLGMYGVAWQENDVLQYYKKGQLDALERFKDLGFNINDISINGRKLLPIQPIKSGDGAGIDETLQVFQTRFNDISFNTLAEERESKKSLQNTLWHRYGDRSGSRDVSYWSAVPKLVEYSPIKGKREYVFIYPSHIYGHTYITTFNEPHLGQFPSNASYTDSGGYRTWDLPPSWSKEYFRHVAFSSTNAFNVSTGNPDRRYAYISPKASLPGRNGQPFLYLSMDRINAGVSVDYVGLYVPYGSSGGYLFNTSSSRAVGISALMKRSCNKAGPYHPSLCSSGFSFLPPEALFYTHDSLRKKIIFNEKIPQSQGFVSRLVGGRGGNKKSFVCPRGFAVAGFVGSSVSSIPGKAPDRVGHLGMVCLPFPTKPYDLLVNSYLNGFSQAKVFTGSSIDTSVKDFNGHLYLSNAEGMELNQYLNEYLSTKTPQPIIQYLYGNTAIRRFGFPPHMNLCAPGYFVSKLYLSSRSYADKNLIESVFAMRCRHWDDGQSYFRLFNNFIGNPDPTNVSVLEAGENLVATGMNISSGWYTDNLSLLFSKVL